ncbi:MAG: hypothetical protein OWU84_01875 [Firmicutes bacterium]|nr:hypothetical protein [Bacillota bacterium]
MKIRDFHITGQYPTLSVETELEDDERQDRESSSDTSTVRITLGPWNYVSLLNAEELKSLVHLVYQRYRHQQPTEAMAQLKGASLQNASSEELP